MKPVQLTVLILSLATGRAGFALKSRPLRDRAQRFAEDAAAFSPNIGRQASRTLALGELAFEGRAIGDQRMLHMVAVPGAKRLWNLSVNDQTMHAGRVVHDDATGDESLFTREVHFTPHQPRGGSKATAIVGYTPAIAHQKTYEIETAQVQLPQGGQVTLREVRRTTIVNGAKAVQVLTRQVGTTASAPAR
jgi:hypothetical protein